MKTILLALIATLAITSAAYADRWGSIAFSSTTGADGYSYNYSYKSDAQDTAISNCEGSADDCRIVVNFRNACGALAVGSRGGWGANWGTTRAYAERNALNACRQHDSGCRVQRWVCSK